MVIMPAAVERRARDAQAVTEPGYRQASPSNSTRRAGAISGPEWSREFEEPIILPDGRKLVTLRDAANYIAKLSKAEQKVEQWQIAIEHLIRAAETGGDWLMLARIGMLRALRRNVVRVFNPDRKDTHLGKRKLKRDL
jgi:hypothetical protein